MPHLLPLKTRIQDKTQEYQVTTMCNESSIHAWISVAEEIQKLLILSEWILCAIWTMTKIVMTEDWTTFCTAPAAETEHQQAALSIKHLLISALTVNYQSSRKKKLPLFFCSTSWRHNHKLLPHDGFISQYTKPSFVTNWSIFSDANHSLVWSIHTRVRKFQEFRPD